MDDNIDYLKENVSRLVAVLFTHGDAIKKSDVAELISDRYTLNQAINTARELLRPLGLVIVTDENTLQMAVAPEQSELVSMWHKVEAVRPLSVAAIETLTTVCYLDGGTKEEIDFIRGVNSYFSLRKLKLRGFVDQNRDRYVPTIAALGNLGVSTVVELPNWREINEQLRSQLHVKSDDVIE